VDWYHALPLPSEKGMAPYRCTEKGVRCASSLQFVPVPLEFIEDPFGFQSYDSEVVYVTRDVLIVAGSVDRFDQRFHMSASARDGTRLHCAQSFV
jgi:hypothetical protein